MSVSFIMTIVLALLILTVGACGALNVKIVRKNLWRRIYKITLAVTFAAIVVANKTNSLPGDWEGMIVYWLALAAFGYIFLYDRSLQETEK